MFQKKIMIWCGLIGFLFSTNCYANIQFNDLYGLLGKIPPQKRKVDLVQGALLVDTPLLKNIYFIGNENLPHTKLVKYLFHSPDNINLVPSKSKSRIISKLTPEKIGRIIALLDNRDLLKIKDKEYFVNLLTNILLGKTEMTPTSAIKIANSCNIKKNEISTFVEEIDAVLKRNQSEIQFHKDHRKKIRELARILFDAIHFDFSQRGTHDQWVKKDTIVNILAALFYLKANENSESAQINIDRFLNGTGHNAPIKLTPFNAITQFQGPPEQDASQWHLFNNIFSSQTYLPPKKSVHTTVTYKDGDTEYAYPDCGASSLFSFYDFIFKSRKLNRVEAPESMNADLAAYLNKKNMDQTPTMQDHIEYAKLSSKLQGVKYVKGDVCEIDSGLKNMIKVLGHHFNKRQTDPNKVFDSILKDLSYPGFELTWQPRNITKEQAIQTDNNLTLDILLNGRPFLAWSMTPNHFDVNPHQSYLDLLKSKEGIMDTRQIGDDYEVYKLTAMPSTERTMMYRDLSQLNSEMIVDLLMSSIKKPNLNDQMISYLFSKLDGHSQSHTYLYLAYSLISKDPLKSKLLEKVKDLDEFSLQRAIYIALNNDHSETLKHLLEKVKDLDYFSLAGAVDTALSNDHSENLKHLLKLKDKNGKYKVTYHELEDIAAYNEVPPEFFKHMLNRATERDFAARSDFSFLLHGFISDKIGDNFSFYLKELSTRTELDTLNLRADELLQTAIVHKNAKAVQSILQIYKNSKSAFFNKDRPIRLRERIIESSSKEIKAVLKLNKNLFELR